MSRRLLWTAVVLAGVPALLLISHVGIQVGKATLAPILIERAFLQAVTKGSAQQPWPGADHRVHSRVQLSEGGPYIYALSDGGMRGMAFGPAAYQSGTATVYIAHRDTHFRPLEDSRIGDIVTQTDIQGDTRRYQVTDIWTAHKDALYLPDSGYTDGLLLVTCYPFDALTTGGPMRYVVWATRIDVG